MKESSSVDNKQAKIKQKRYIDFNTKVLIRSLLVCLAIIFAVLFINMSINKNKTITVNYGDNGNINYKVYLKPNNFYDKDYLEENMTYIASLIDHIDVSFRYNFIVDQLSNLDYTYKIVGNLIITPESNSDNILYSKNYVLVSDVNESLKNTSSYNLDKNLSIDYNTYNEIANSFKATYGVSSDSKLIIKLIVDTKGKDIKYETEFNSSGLEMLTLPLSTKQINVKIDTSNTNKTGSVQKDISNFIENKVLFGIGIVFIIIGLVALAFLMCLIIKLKPKKDKYKKFVTKILNDYDRTIVETNRMPILDDHDVYKVTKFSELLDVRDNLKIPIMYVKINSEKCCFYVKDNNVLYIYYVKSVDL